MINNMCFKQGEQPATNYKYFYFSNSSFEGKVKYMLKNRGHIIYTK